MILTKRQLRRIIRESLTEGLGDNEIALDFIEGAGKWPKGFSDGLRKESQLTWNTKDAGPTEYSIYATDDIPKIKAFVESMFGGFGQQPSGWMKKALDKYNAEGPYRDDAKLTATPSTEPAPVHDDEKTIIITFHEDKE